MTEQILVQTEQEKPETLSEAEEQVYQTLIPHLEELAINLDDFKEENRQENIKIDKEKVQQRKEELKQMGQSEISSSKKRSKILEALMAEQIEISDWFGPNVNTVIASEFDDLFNSIDMVVEFGDEKEKDSHYDPVGIDVTSTTERIEKKLYKIRDSLRQWGGSRIRYFRSERQNPKTTLKEMPRLIIGVEPELLEELSKLWLEANEHRLENRNPLELSSQEKQKIRAARESLAKHRTAKLILEELKIQLETIIKFAKKYKEDPSKFERLLTIVKGLLKLKNIDSEDENKNNQDKIYQTIRHGLEKTFTQ